MRAKQEVNTRLNEVIFHIDVNSAFLSWEAVYRLAHRGETQDLREIVSAVGGDVTMRHGIILAKSIPAKKYGIRTGETILEARGKCPGLTLVPANYELYEECSAAFLEILRDYSDIVEPYSIDEAFVDMSASCHLFGTPEDTAAQIKNRIRDELGFTVNVGVSGSRLLAKMASDFQKPDRVHTLYQEEIRQKMWPLPVSDLFFVGRATARKLHAMGIGTIGELACADLAWIREILKKPGETVWRFANGTDPSVLLQEQTANKGYGNSTTTPFDVKDIETANRVLLSLCDMVASRLRADRVEIGVVSVGIRYAGFAEGKFPFVSHQRTLHGSTNLTKEIYEAARGLLKELWNGSPVRHLGVHTGRVSGETACRQMNLFEEIDYEKLSCVDRTVDTLRRRYGTGVVTRAALLNTPFAFSPK